jgi:hypothetical protein
MKSNLLESCTMRRPLILGRESGQRHLDFDEGRDMGHPYVVFAVPLDDNGELPDRHGYVL